MPRVGRPIAILSAALQVRIAELREQHMRPATIAAALELSPREVLAVYRHQQHDPNSKTDAIYSLWYGEVFQPRPVRCDCGAMAKYTIEGRCRVCFMRASLDLTGVCDLETDRQKHNLESDA